MQAPRDAGSVTPGQTPFMAVTPAGEGNLTDSTSFGAILTKQMLEQVGVPPPQASHARTLAQPRDAQGRPLPPSRRGSGALLHVGSNPPSHTNLFINARRANELLNGTLAGTQKVRIGFTTLRLSNVRVAIWRHDNPFEGRLDPLAQAGKAIMAVIRAAALLIASFIRVMPKIIHSNSVAVTNTRFKGLDRTAVPAHPSALRAFTPDDDINSVPRSGSTHGLGRIRGDMNPSGTSGHNLKRLNRPSDVA